MSDLGFVVSLVFDTRDSTEARAIAEQVVRSLDGLMPKLLLESTTVHPEGRPGKFSWVLCAHRMDEGLCRLPYAHCGEHDPNWAMSGSTR